jgi:hypothetical protein
VHVSAQTDRDDRVLKPTRVISIVIIPILTAAFVLLYLFPTRTEQLWSWTINPTMSALVMGGGYLSGAYFFYRAATVRQWHRIGLGFLAITVFATMLGVATLVHWDRFNHDHVSFWAWAGLYWSTPLLLPWLWVVNRRRDPHTLEPGDRVVPAPIRTVIVAVGAAQLVVAGLMYFRPTALLDRSPWMLTPLTARSLSAFVAVPAVIYLCFAVERRWSALRILVEVVMLGLTFIGIAAVVAWDEFQADAVLVWGWRVGLLVALALLGALWVAMSRPESPRSSPSRAAGAAAQAA